MTLIADTNYLCVYMSTIDMLQTFRERKLCLMDRRPTYKHDCIPYKWAFSMICISRASSSRPRVYQLTHCVYYLRAAVTGKRARDANPRVMSSGNAGDRMRVRRRGIITQPTCSMTTSNLQTNVYLCRTRQCESTQSTLQMMRAMMSLYSTPTEACSRRRTEVFESFDAFLLGAALQLLVRA